MKVLTIDGGGMRGLLPALILAEIERRCGRPISAMVDLIAGTSTGGLLALGLTLDDVHGQPKFSAASLCDMYRREGGRIFRKKNGLATLFGVLDEGFRSDGLEAVLGEYFGDARLGDALCPVLVPAFDLVRRKPFYFSSRLGRYDSSEDFLCRVVGRATSAAPTFFEPSGELDGFALIDGGVLCNNPAALGYAEALNMLRGREAVLASVKPRGLSVVDVAPVQGDTEVVLLSMGTGEVQRSYSLEESRGWGMAGWARPLVDVFMSSGGQSVDYQMQHILPPSSDGRRNYLRINPMLPVNALPFGDASPKHIEQLEMVANWWMGKNEAVLDGVCSRLLE